MDITNIQYPDQCFEIIIDKGTTDCLFCAKNSYGYVVKALKVLLIINSNVYRTFTRCLKRMDTISG